MSGTVSDLGGTLPSPRNRRHPVRAVCLLLVLLLGVNAVPAQTTIFDLESLRATIRALDLRYSVTDNWVVQLSAAERRQLGGALTPSALGTLPRWRNSKGIPDRAALDWRDRDGDSFVSGVRNQQSCGSCWDFAGVAMLESALMIGLDLPNTDPDYSEQRILSCIDIPYYPSSCASGYLNATLEYLRLAGTPPEPCFPYESTHVLPCDFSCAATSDQVQKLATWGFVTGSELDIDAIKNALASGPVGTWFRIYNSFYAYDSGVYSAHGSTYSGVNHLVLIVGYDDSQQCWIAKNSWSESWGEDGFFRIAYDSGCDFGLWTQACSYLPTWDPTVWWSPSSPVAGSVLTVSYAPAGRPLATASQVWFYYGFNDWQGSQYEAMTWNGGTNCWEVDCNVPADAGSLQFDFTDGVGVWDNNGGCDWSVEVTGSTAIFVLDGQLDAGVPLLASGGDLSLWARWEGSQLYLATEGSGTTPGLDHFLLVAADTSATGPAPWAKNGTIISPDFFVGAENSTGWSGWFDGDETGLTGASFAQAQGAVLEGVIDIPTVYAGSSPARLWLAAACYDSEDGGDLTRQAPAGNGNSQLEIAEYLRLEHPLTGIETTAPVAPLPSCSLHPNPFNPTVSVRLHIPHRQSVRVELFDLGGRKLATLWDGLTDPGPLEIPWDGRNHLGHTCASGVYFFRIESESFTTVLQGALLK
ncbi:MAG: C1 family peptidase [bacterium]